MDFIYLESMVYNILWEFEATRSDDRALYLACCVKFNPQIENATFKEIMSDSKVISTMPNYESITRIRRKLQARYPEVRANEEMKEIRAKRRREFEAYAKKRLHT